VALAGGGGLGVYLDDFHDARVLDPALLDLSARVRCVGDSECDELFPVTLPTIARVRTRAGEEREVRVLDNRGGPRRPLSAEELTLKFRLNAERSLSNAKVDELNDALDAVPQLDNLGGLASALVG